MHLQFKIHQDPDTLFEFSIINLSFLNWFIGYTVKKKNLRVNVL